MSTIFPMKPSDFSKTMSVFLDFHRNYLFRVLFFDNMLSGVFNVAQALIITYLISETATPVTKSDSIPLGWQGGKIKIAGQTDFQDWKCTLRDDHLNLTSNYFQKWRNQIYDYKDGTSHWIDSYKKSALVILLPNKNALDISLATKGYLISGIWPKEIGEVSLSYGTESIITFPVTFSIDWFEPYSVADIASSLI